MADARLEKALALIHQEPWRDWTLNGLCAQVGLSKTASIQKFDRHFQLPPMEYLTRWRMQIAADWLSESGMTVEKVASRCGYDSLRRSAAPSNAAQAPAPAATAGRTAAPSIR